MTTDSDNYLSENTSATTSGKFFQIYVPNWGQDGAGANLSSFIRLGATPANFFPATTWAPTLIGQFSGFFDDPRQRYDGTSTATAQSLPGVTGTGPSGLLSDGKTAANCLSPADRAAETGNLQTKGGWWDHSDGNRVSTTQGDKVEVIRGNYQLIVLGRQDSTSDGATLDMSGGLAQPGDATPANLMRLEWVRNYDGTWRSVEECQKGDVHNVTHGDVFEEQYGQKITSITGSEKPKTELLANPEKYFNGDAALHANGTAEPLAIITQNNDLFDPVAGNGGYIPGFDANGAPKPAAGTIQTKLNPTIVERTWAESISSYTGSAACLIPSIHEETWAAAISEITQAGTINSTTVAGSIDEATTVGTHNELTTVGVANSVTILDAKAEVTVCAGAMAEVTVAPGQLGVSAVGLNTSIDLGGKIDLFLGAKFEFSAPARLAFGVEDGKIVAESTKAKADETRLVAMETKIAESGNDITGMKTKLHEVATELSEEHTKLAGTILLGI